MKAATRLITLYLTTSIAILWSIVGLATEVRPNVVMIVIDDMRMDEWSGGGHEFLETPNIDSPG